MKQNLLLMFVVIVLLTSCNTETSLEADRYNAKLEKVIFQIASKEDQTCTAISSEVNRYIMEVYDHNGEHVNCFPYADSPLASNHAESTNGEFIAILNKERTYNILFWADNGISYTARNLKEISLVNNQSDSNQNTRNQKMSEHAYFAKKEGKILSLNNVYLKRALAKINFIQKGSDMSGTSGTKEIIIRYDNNYKFNCYDGRISPSFDGSTRIFTIINATITDGIILGTDYCFANATVEKDSTLISLMINLESISNIPLTTNKVTNIMGQYSSKGGSSKFTFNQSDKWNIPK